MGVFRFRLVFPELAGDALLGARPSRRRVVLHPNGRRWDHDYYLPVKCELDGTVQLFLENRLVYTIFLSSMVIYRVHLLSSAAAAEPPLQRPICIVGIVLVVIGLVGVGVVGVCALRQLLEDGFHCMPDRAPVIKRQTCPIIRAG